MRNPLNKRILREFWRDRGKYVVILLFMILMIGTVSGMYIGHDSMLAAIAAGERAQHLEDGHFEVNRPASPELLKRIASGERADLPQTLKGEETFRARRVTLAENFYKNEQERRDGDSLEATIRVFRRDTKMNQACINEGREPENADEIAIDRTHASTVGLHLGDSIRVGTKDFQIVGLLSYVHYKTLLENNSDLLFDAQGFDVGMLTPEAFEQLPSRTHYAYAFVYDEKPRDDIESKAWSKDFLQALLSQTIMTDLQVEAFVPAYLNQAIHFAVDDIEDDSAGASILIYILIAVIAFIFAVTMDSTIEKEASAIGTLRASGYTKRELIRHYMTAAVSITLLGAVIGNLLGYTVFKDLFVASYYDSYSLPTYKTLWSPMALVKTTLIPLILMFGINYLVIVRKLRLSPLRFLRHDLRKNKTGKARRLPHVRFTQRFRLRIVFQNIPNFLILIFGVLLIEVMLCFAFGFPDSLDHYARTASDKLLAPYQYMFADTDGNAVTTEEKSAEPFRATRLLRRGQEHDEDVWVYGFSQGSRAVAIRERLLEKEVFISRAMAEKYNLQRGDTLSLSEKYEHKSHTFSVKGIYPYDGGIAIFMPRENFNSVLGRSSGSFNGFFSERAITDVDENQLLSVLTEKDITKISEQLNRSLGGMMRIFQYTLLVLSFILLYLLSKVLIEKNEAAISMVKILGFRNGEIASLYLLPGALMVLFATGLGFGAGYYIVQHLFKLYMLKRDGWFAFYLSPRGATLSILFLLIGYVFVTALDLRRIRNSPLDKALKNMD